jgi:hypothetical protein
MLRGGLAIQSVVTACLLLWISTLPAAEASKAPDTKLFDFVNEADVKNWSALHDPASKSQDPEPKAEWSSDGSHAMKITFNGGQWPAVSTSNVAVSDWTPFNVVKAEVSVSVPCVVGFRAYSEANSAITARWEKTAFLQTGQNKLVLPINLGKFSGKDIHGFDIFMYRPAPGDALQVGSLSLAKERQTDPAGTEYSVLGTDLKVKDIADLEAKTKDRPAKPESASADQVESEFKSRYEEVKKEHPSASIAILRNGEKGWDPAHSEKVYEGWKDSVMCTHPPDANLAERSRNYGEVPQFSSYSRNTVFRIMQTDLTFIPKGSNILAAQLMLLRSTGTAPQDAHPETTTFIAEACNRDWDEAEINAYQYAKGKVWKELGGANWSGDDPDFLPQILAYGRSQGNVNVWDFTEAVKFWTDGTHANHGFSWYCQYHFKDFWRTAPSRRAKNVKERPALMVIYEPKQ